MMPGHKVQAERAELLTHRLTLEAIASVLRAAGFVGETPLELATDAAEQRHRARWDRSDLRGLARREHD